MPLTLCFSCFPLMLSVTDPPEILRKLMVQLGSEAPGEVVDTCSPVLQRLKSQDAFLSLELKGLQAAE